MNIGEEKINLTRSAGPAGDLDADVIVVSLDTAKLALHQSRTELMRKCLGRVHGANFGCSCGYACSGKCSEDALIKLAEEEGIEL